MNETVIFIKCRLNYSLVEPGSAESSGGKAVAVIEKEYLSILAESGQDLVFALRDTERIIASDYKISITLLSGEKIRLDRLGYRYEDFVRILFQCRNEIILQDMLAQEVIRKKDVTADVEYLPDAKGLPINGKCRVRLYETSLVILPEQGEVVRIPFGLIENVSCLDYRLEVLTETGEHVFLSKLGTELDPLKKSLTDALNNLGVRTHTFLKELLPGVDGVFIRQLSALMKDGRAVAKSKVADISPSMWLEMEKVLKTTAIGPRYEYLTTLGNAENSFMGFKRGLLGDLTGDTVWFLVPFYSNVPGKPGNAVVMEMARLPQRETEESAGVDEEEGGEEGSGHATYVFRFLDRDVYRMITNMDELEQQMKDFVNRFNRNMLTINFRRLPVYLPEKRFDEPDYIKYKFSLKRLPALRMLRAAFIGRVMHRSVEQWQADVLNVLQFNVDCRDNDKKWEKGG